MGYNEPTRKTNREIVKAFDLFLGVPSILIEPTNERKSTGYGCAGNYRNKPYGLEFRTLSSYFMSSEELVNWVLNNANKAIDFVNQGQNIDELAEVIQNTINNEDKEMAKRLINDFNLELV